MTVPACSVNILQEAQRDPTFGCIENDVAGCVQEHIVQETEGMVLDRLEELHSKLARLNWQNRLATDRLAVIQAAEDAFDAMVQA